MPPLIAIVAMASNRVIGKAGQLPWRIPEDLRFFKETTLGHPIVMGRKTFDSLGKPLPGRRNIVISRSLAPRDGIEVLPSTEALTTLDFGAAEKVFLIGGAALFAELLPHCSGLYLTHVAHPHEGDTLMPPFEHLFEQPQVLRQGEGLEFRYYPAKALGDAQAALE